MTKQHKTTKSHGKGKGHKEIDLWSAFLDLFKFRLKAKAKKLKDEMKKDHPNSLRGKK